ncbi:MAG: Protein phosphatase 2C 1 [Bathelium mastoideum]|nr:MAG: Protein phosphatase 2C 1 [Bathelium mastoideum]
MFGTSGSPPKEDDTLSEPQSPADLQKPGGDGTGDAGNGADGRNTSGHSPPGRKPIEDGGPSGEKKRRSSGVSKARDIFSNAKQSLHLHGSPANNNGQQEKTPQTPIQKLSKTDPALSVPQGSYNNSAGESVPGPRSTFRVGVTEDKNKKCRRTMEDTHAYLYNFLSTPAPSLGADSSSKGSNSVVDAMTTSLDSSLQHVVETDNGYFAIFDGHAGTFAADWCGKKLHLLLEETIRKNPNTPIPELLDSTFTNVDQQLEKLPLKNSGCTAVIAVLRWEDRIPNSQSATGSSAIAPAAAAAVKAASEPSGNAMPNAHAPGNASTDGQTSTEASTDPAKAALQDHRPSAPQEVRLRENASRQRVLYTANVGDARIVLCRNGKALRLSYDHKGSDENEGKRIANAGGLILNNRVNGVLAVTRALGDSYMKDLVTGHPYTTETVIQPDIDEFLILACDGLWDVCNDQEAVDLVRQTVDPQAASKQLVDHALSRFSTDNLSCMIVRFDNKAVQNTVDRKTEPIGVDGDPASKEGGISEAEHLVLQSKKNLDESGEAIPPEYVAPESIEEEDEAEPGPELNADALQAARKRE